MVLKFGSDYKEVRCSDGPRYILKKPEKAFSIAAPKWDFRIKSLLKFYESMEATLETDVKKDMQSIIKDLSENYAALQAHYQAVYLTFCANPCSKESERVCQEAMAEIREKEYRLRVVEVKTETLSNKLLATSKLSGAPIIKMRRIREREEKGIKNILASTKAKTDIFESVEDLKNAIDRLK